MKKVLTAAILVVASATASFAGTTDLSPYQLQIGVDNLNGSDLAGHWKKPFAKYQLQGDDGRSSHITVRGRYGADVDRDHMLEGIWDMTNSPNNWDGLKKQTAGRVGSTNDKRDWVEYKVTNGDREFFILELEDEEDLFHVGEPDRVCDKTKQGCTLVDESIYARARTDHAEKVYRNNSFYGETDWDNFVVVESNFNSKKYIEDIQKHTYGKYHNVYGDIQVQFEGNNELAKQIVASSVALAWGKFDNLSAYDTQKIINDNLGGGRYFGNNVLHALMTPAGTLK